MILRIEPRIFALSYILAFLLFFVFRQSLTELPSCLCWPQICDYPASVLGLQVCTMVWDRKNLTFQLCILESWTYRLPSISQSSRHLLKMQITGIYVSPRIRFSMRVRSCIIEKHQRNYFSHYSDTNNDSCNYLLYIKLNIWSSRGKYSENLKPCADSCVKIIYVKTVNHLQVNTVRHKQWNHLQTKRF